MGSKQNTHGSLGLSRSNTFQRMLDVEKRGKISRMQSTTTAPPVVRSSTFPTPLPETQSTRRPTLQNTGRAMSTPSLSLNVPPPKTRYVLKAGDVVPEEEADAGAESETSSICRSPGWDDVMGSKRKREKKEAKMRKKEKEKAEAKALAKAKTEAKHAEKLRNRLSKATAPPTTRRLSKAGGPTARSSSVPTAPKPDGISSGSTEEPNINEEGAKRGSIEVGLKSFIQATQAIPVSWRSFHGTPASATPDRTSPSQEQPSLSLASRHDNFIGGLKLKLVEEASSQQQAWRQSQDEYDATKESQDEQTITEEEGKFDLGLDEMSNRTPSIGEDERKFELRLEELDNHNRPKRNAEDTEERFNDDAASVRTPQQWESIYEQAARIMRTAKSSQSDSENYNAPEGDTKRNRDRTYPPTSYFPVDADGHRPRRNSSVSSNSRTDSRPGSSEDRASSRLRSDDEAKRPFSQSRYVSDESGKSADRGRGDIQGSVGQQRKPSQNQPVSGAEDDSRGHVPAGEKSESSTRGRKSSWASMKSFSRTSSTDAPSTIRVAKCSNIEPNTDRQSYHAALLEGYTPASPPSDECTSPEGKPSHKPTLSKGSLPGLKGFKSAARAAFVRKSSFVSSSSVEPIKSPAEDVAEPRQPRKRPSTIFIGTDGRTGKAERFFGQPISASSNEDVSDFRPRSTGQFSSFSFQATPRAMERQEPGQSLWNHEIGDRSETQPASHSRSTTVSSEEEYSTFDESSNVTTPMASTHKAYYPVADESVNTQTQTSQGHGEQGSQAVAADTITAFASNNQKKAPSNIVADVGSLKNRPPNSDQPSAEIPTSLSRHPSLSRSVSTPELQQDLSFLPALRHQPLTKPAKSKDAKAGKGMNSSTTLPELNGHLSGKPDSLIKPEILSPPASKGKGSFAPQSPVSSQYLKNARLSLPRQPRSGATGPPHAHGTAHGGAGAPLAGAGPGPAGVKEPIAKMFVICCSCKYFHDLPSKIYECMARSESVVEDKDLGVSGLVSTSVRCPWCNHGMTTACCAGWAAVVVLSERLH